MEAEIIKAKKLLADNGFSVEKIAGQSMIQIIRSRTDDEPFWRYKINKTHRNLFAEPGQEIQHFEIEVAKIPWETFSVIERGKP